MLDDPIALLTISTSSTGLVAQWIRHRPTEPGIAGSSPAEVIVLIAWQLSHDEMPPWGR
jgi:hypothetical protein